MFYIYLIYYVRIVHYTITIKHVYFVILTEEELFNQIVRAIKNK